MRVLLVLLVAASIAACSATEPSVGPVLKSVNGGPCKRPAKPDSTVPIPLPNC